MTDRDVLWSSNFICGFSDVVLLDIDSDKVLYTCELGRAL